MMNETGSFAGGISMGFGGFFMLLFWGLIILGIIAAVKWIFGSSTNASGPTQKNALEILQERYAHGEIDEQEYQQKRRDLLQ